MGFKIIFAPQAIERLSSIVGFIARDKPEAAERFGLRLISQTEILADFPDLGRPYQKRKNVRRLYCRPYFIYYRVSREDKIVEIMDFWHSSQQDPKLH
jgi:plasmid stabilization system protein ParE